MRRLMVVLCVGTIVAMVMVAYAVPAMAQTPQEKRQAEQLLQMAADAGIAIPSDPEARIQLAAQYGITISPGVAAAMDGAGSKSGNQKAAKSTKGKALPKTGGATIGSLLGLGAGAALVGGGLVAHSRARRRA